MLEQKIELDQLVDNENELTLIEKLCFKIINEAYNEPISIEKIFQELYKSSPQQEEDLIPIFNLIQSIRNKQGQEVIIELKGMEGLYMTRGNYDITEKESNRVDQRSNLGKELSSKELWVYLIILRNGATPISLEEIYYQLYRQLLPRSDVRLEVQMTINRIRRKFGSNSILYKKNGLEGSGFVASRAVIQANLPEQKLIPTSENVLI